MGCARYGLEILNASTFIRDSILESVQGKLMQFNVAQRPDQPGQFCVEGTRSPCKIRFLYYDSTKLKILIIKLFLEYACSKTHNSTLA